MTTHSEGRTNLFLASLLGGLGDLATGLVGLLDGLDDTDSNLKERPLVMCCRCESIEDELTVCLMSRTAKRPRGG